jgi:hypothetical protein
MSNNNVWNGPVWNDELFNEDPTLVTPVIEVTGDDDETCIRIGLQGQTGDVDHNDLYKDGVRICDSLAKNGTYLDYDVASGVTYEYRVTARDSAGNGADSLTHSAMVSFCALRLHQCTIGAESNKLGALLTLWNTRQQSLSATRAENRLVLPAKSQVVVETGDIISRIFEAPIMVRIADLETLRNLRIFLAEREVMTLRDGLGKLIRCTMEALTSSFDVNYEIPLKLDETDYDASV